MGGEESTWNGRFNPRLADARTIPRELRLCTQAGREYGIQLFTATQEPHRVNSSILGQSTEMVCFRLQEPKAWACVKDWGGDVDRVAALPLGSFVSYDRLTLEGKLF